LSIAIPAMMIGHLTIAGLAELAVSAGVVAFLQRSDLSLLRATAGKVRESLEAAPQAAPKSLRPLWVGLAILCVLTPLGILAAGSAWGEWMASDYADAGARHQIASASLNHEAPARAPEGLARLSAVWTAPFARYAPPYIRGAAFGYLLSGMFGAGLIVVGFLVLGNFTRSAMRAGPDSA